MVRRLFLTPPTLPETTVTRCLIIPNDKLWLGIFNAALLATTYWYNYEQVNDTDLTPEAVAAKCYEIYETYISEECEVCSCNCPTTLYRWTEDGELEQSTDNGLTWIPAPFSDPRNTAPLFAPLPLATGEVTQCAAAENIVTNFTNQIDQYADQLQVLPTFLEISLAVADGVALFLGVFAPYTAFVAAIAIELISHGEAAVRAAFDSNVWDRLKCNIFCRVYEDGTVTSAIIGEIKAQIDIDETGITNILLKQMIDTLGPNGMTNAGRVGGADGDTCDDCACECLTEELYATTGVAWAGGTEGTDGGCGFGRFIGAGYGGAATFTIPNRGARTVIGVNIFVCDATLGGAQTTSVTAGGTASDESPLGVTAGWNAHTWAVAEDDDTIVVNDVAGGWVFINSIQIVYDCP